MGSCAATSETNSKRKNAHTAYDFNFSSLFFRSVFFLLVCCSFLSQLADLRKEALAGWPGKKVEIGEGEEMGGGRWEVGGGSRFS